MLQVIRRVRDGFGSFTRTVGRVIQLNWQVSPGLYIGQMMITVFQGLVPLVLAYLTGALIGHLTSVLTGSSHNERLLFELAIALGLVQFVSNQVSFLSSYLDDLHDLKFDSFVQLELMRKFASLDQSYYEDGEFNNKLNKVNQNLYALRGLNRNFFMAVQALVEAVASGIAMVTLGPVIALILVALLVPILVIEVRTSKRRWRTWEERGLDMRLQYFTRSMLTDSEKIQEIKLYGLTSYMMERWKTYFTSFRKLQISVERYAQRQRAMSGIIDAAAQIGIQLWLIARALRPGSGFGIAQFIFYRQIIQNFTGSGRSVVRSIHTMQESVLYVNDYFDILALEPRLVPPTAGITLGTEVPSIEFRDVWFSYPGSKRPILKGVSFTIAPGEDVALVGANGAGKSTLIKLLLRLYDPTKGQILVNGHDLREVDLESWYTQLGVLFQSFNHYAAYTVRDTVGMGRITTEPTERRLKQALTEGGADEFVREYPHGLDQRLRKSFEDGIDPSGGQWQRLALARAFFRKANLLILDEPTSAIDAKGEAEIFARIAATQQDKSAIIISHRFSTVRTADTIVVLEDGKVLEHGSHEELMKQRGRYHELFELQAQAYR